MRKLIIALALLCFTSTAYAEDSFDWQLFATNTLYATALAVEVGDWQQTRQIAMDPIHHGERNLILGFHPTVSQVNAYFPVAIGLTAISYPLMQPQYRPWLYGLITVAEGYTVIRNRTHGLKFNFLTTQF